MEPSTVREYDRAVEHLLARIAAACESEARWPARLLRGCEELAAFLGEEPKRAHLLTGEALALAGGVDRHRASVDRLADLLRPARSYYRGAEALPADTERVLVEGLRATLGATFADEPAGPGLPLAADLAELALAPYAGAAQARDAIESELGRRRGGPKTLAGLRLPPAVASADQRRRILAATVEECQ
jgi:hypothetical protein